jgi:hypothetical protein
MLLDARSHFLANGRSIVIESKPSLEELKEEIDDLRRTLDYLEKKGSRAEKETFIKSQIESVKRRLKELYAEEY